MAPPAMIREPSQTHICVGISLSSTALPCCIFITMYLRFALIFLFYIRTASAQCQWATIASVNPGFLFPALLNWHQVGSFITDLRTPTPFTLTEEYIFTNCSATPTTVANTLTAYVDHQSHTANPVTYQFTADSGTVTKMHTFSDLPVTLFQPGDLIPYVYISQSRLIVRCKGMSLLEGLTSPPSRNPKVLFAC